MWCNVHSMLWLVRAILYINSADTIKQVLKSSVGPKMAENTLLQRENDYRNKREYLEHHSNLANTKLKKTVMHKIFSKTTLNCAKKSGCMKYFSTYNLFSVLLPNIYIAVFWTLCQCMIGSVTTSLATC